MAHGDPSNVFAFPDFDRVSTWLTPTEPQALLFTANLEKHEHSQRFRLAGQATNKDFFQIPDTFGLHGLDEQTFEDEQSEPLVEPLHDVSLQDVDSLDGFWQGGQSLKSEAIGHRTWDGFLLPETPFVTPLFITEAGAPAYDAAIRSKGDPLKTASNDDLIVQSNAYLAALLALSLGRGSVFFAWDHKNARFRPATKSLRVSGYSTASLQDLQDSCLHSGATIRFLSEYVKLTYRRRTSPAKVALARTVDTLLFALQRRLGDYGGKVRSTLQLQSLIEPVGVLLAHLRDLITKLTRIKTDEQILSKLFHETQLLENDNSLLRSVMCEILSRVSEPWTDFSEKWLGVKSDEGSQMTLNGPGKSFAKVANFSRVDDAGFETEEADYVLDESCMPDFVPTDVALAMFETGKTLRLLRTYHPDHPLGHPENVSSKPPPLRWLFDWRAIKNLQHNINSYEEAMLHVISKNRGVNVTKCATPLDYVGEATEMKIFGCDSSLFESQLLASMKALDQAPVIANTQDSLTILIENHLSQQGSTHEQVVPTFNPHWSLLPFHSFGPLVSAQARLINREYMKLLFSTHDLREHLRVQKEFQLLGNGMFCSRLSHALFDADMETAERQSGVALQGGVMGLRLTGRDNWPPASSELRLSLMGIINETYFRPFSRSHEAAHGENIELPGDLSFTIRDMTPEEIDKCIDPDSLEALDFLRLSYKAPRPLSPVLTAGTLVKYDRIFRLLLRLLRLQYVVGQVFRNTSTMARSGRASCNSWLRLQSEARHFVQSISAYFGESGIQRAWGRFESWLDQTQLNLEQDGVHTRKTPVVSPDQVREEHEKMLDRIMHTLLLRKRQQPVLALLEEIFVLILKFAKQSQLESEGKVEGSASKVIIDALYSTFKKKMGIFIAVCESLNEKGGRPSKTGKHASTTADGMRHIDDGVEENTFDRLLVNLDMAGYYSRPRF